MENEKAKLFIKQMPKEIQSKSKIRKIENGKIVALKGNEIKSIYISCQGKMQVKNEFENGFIYSFASIEPIAYIGIMELMADKLTYSSTLQTTTECTVVEIPKDDFLNWMFKDQQLTLQVLRFLSSSMYEQSIKRGEGLAYPALCVLIGYLMNVFESEPQEEVFLEKTREEISTILGFSVRTLNRNLKLLKEENLISVTRKGILITKEQFDKLSKKLEQFK